MTRDPQRGLSADSSRPQEHSTLGPCVSRLIYPEWIRNIVDTDFQGFVSFTAKPLTWNTSPVQLRFTHLKLPAEEPVTAASNGSQLSRASSMELMISINQ